MNTIKGIQVYNLVQGIIVAEIDIVWKKRFVMIYSYHIMKEFYILIVFVTVYEFAIDMID